MDIKKIIGDIIEKPLDLPIDIVGNYISANKNRVKYFVNNIGVFTKDTKGNKNYLQIMFGRKKKITKFNKLNFFDIIDPECYESLSAEEKEYFYPVIKCCTTSTENWSTQSTYYWMSFEHIMYFNFGIKINKEKLFTNKIIDKLNKEYPIPSNKYFPKSNSRVNFFNKVTSQKAAKAKLKELTEQIMTNMLFKK